MNHLKCREISKAFGQVRALERVSLEACGGEILALLGGNGSGKSTIAKVIGGVYQKDSGEVMLNDSVLNINSPIAAKRAGVIVTSQELSLMDNFTVAQNICLSKVPVKKVWTDGRAVGEIAEEVLKKCGLSSYGGRSVASLEENEKYLVEFAKAIVMKPKVLILDEITSALYQNDVAVIRNILMDLKEQGCIIIIITHRMNEIFDMCDKVTVLRNGEYVDTFWTSEVTENELLFAMTGHDVRKAVKVGEEAGGEEERESLISVTDHQLSGFRGQIQFELKKGEVIGVAGLQGQGQSQLVRELFAMDKPTQMVFKGEPIILKNPSDAVKRKFAFISGNREKEGSFGNRSIQENISVISDLILSANAEAKETVLGKYKVKMGRITDAIRTLSGGNQQKVILGRWTITNPDVLLLDDPTKGIDVNARMDVHGIIAELADQGAGVVFVSSDEEELIGMAKYCHQYKIVVMYNGEVKKVLSGKEMTKENIFLYAIPQGGDSE